MTLDRSQLIAEINTDFANNFSGAITAADLRQVTTDIVNNTANLTDANVLTDGLIVSGDNGGGYVITITGSGSTGGVSFDSAAITTDGSGDLTIAGTNYNANPSLYITDNSGNTLTACNGAGVGLSVLGQTQLDNGAITTNGSGNVTLVGLQTADGNVTIAEDSIEVSTPNASSTAVITASSTTPSWIVTLVNDQAALAVQGPTTLDMGAITTDGTGNLTVSIGNIACGGTVSGTIDATGGFSGTGSYTNFTIVNGIITAAS